MNNKIQGFESWLYGRGTNPESITRILLTIRRVHKRYNNLTPLSFESYILDLQRNRNKPNYINREISNIKNYSQYADIEFSIPYQKKKETIKSIMTDREIEDFINLPRLPKAPRSTYETFQMFWLILSQTGMRPKELATLRSNQLREDGIFLNETKTGHPRFVPLIPETARKLQEYAKGKNLIFTNKKGNQLNKQHWSREFRQRVKIMGIKREGLTAYSLRHSKITRMIEDDISPFKIRKIVGHANIQSTLNYEHLTTKDVIIANGKDRLLNKNLSKDTKSQILIETIQKQLTKEDSFDIQKTEDGVQLKITWG